MIGQFARLLVMTFVFASETALADTEYLNPISSYPPATAVELESDYSRHEHQTFPLDEAIIRRAYGSVPVEFYQIEGARNKFAIMLRRNHALVTLVRNGYWTAAGKELAYLTVDNHFLEKDIRRIVDDTRAPGIIEQTYLVAAETALESQPGLSTHQKSRMSHFYRETLRKMSTPEFKKRMPLGAATDDDRLGIGTKLALGFFAAFVPSLWMALDFAISIPNLNPWISATLAFVAPITGSLIMALVSVSYMTQRQLWAPEKVKLFRNACIRALSPRGLLE